MCLQLVNQRGIAGIIGRIASSASEYYSGLLPKRKTKNKRKKKKPRREERSKSLRNNEAESRE